MEWVLGIAAGLVFFGLIVSSALANLLIIICCTAAAAGLVAAASWRAEKTKQKIFSNYPTYKY
jgi:hypothetical protein